MPTSRPYQPRVLDFNSSSESDDDSGSDHFLSLSLKDMENPRRTKMSQNSTVQTPNSPENPRKRPSIPEDSDSEDEKKIIEKKSPIKELLERIRNRNKMRLGASTSTADCQKERLVKPLRIDEKADTGETAGNQGTIAKKPMAEGQKTSLNEKVREGLKELENMVEKTSNTNRADFGLAINDISGASEKNSVPGDTESESESVAAVSVPSYSHRRHKEETARRTKKETEESPKRRKLRRKRVLTASENSSDSEETLKRPVRKKLRKKCAVDYTNKHKLKSSKLLKKLEFLSRGYDSPPAIYDSSTSAPADNDSLLENGNLENRPEFFWSEFAFGDPKIFPFKGDPGLLIPVKNPTEPISYFSMILTDKVLNTIVHYTNLAAIKSCGNRRSNGRRTLDLTKQELLEFLALHLHIINMQTPTVNEYWSTDPTTWLLPMRGRLNRYRFARICQHLQFENHSSNRDIPDSEKALARMKPFVNLLQNQFKSIYYPTRNLTISETKFGLYESVSHYDWLVETTEMPEAQVYELHDCTGFIYNICLHVANQTPAQTVQKLMKSLLGNGHAMYLSSTYSSVPLAHSLSEKNTYLTGTFLPSPTEDFKFPSEMFDSRCQSLKLESNKIFVGKLDCSLQPNLCTISTEFDHEETLRNVVAAEKPIPNCIYHYQNVLMTIFNREFVEFHSNAVNKGPKLYLQIFFHLINICIQNAYVLYKLNNLQSTMDFRQFRQQLVRTIFDLPVRAEVEESIPLDAHKPAKIVLTKGKRPIKRCVMCSARGCKTKFSTICCPDCPGQPTLCQNSKRNCFAEWHSNQQSSKTDEDESEF